MNLKIRNETSNDHDEVDRIIKGAFQNAEHTDGNEHELVARLRKAQEFLPELSLVAEIEGKIVGHVILTPINIEDPSGRPHQSLALAPISVDPEYQKRGIGSKLIRCSHEKAKELGFKSIILLGHPRYYPKFGYTRASLYDIRAPFEVPDEAFMAIELIDGGLRGVSGIVKYPPSFGF